MKRYPEYKDSGIDWTGKIPEYWDVVQIKRVLTSVANGTTATQLDFDTEYPVSRIETISTGKINFEKIGYLDSATADDRFKLAQGDILLSHINSLDYKAF